MLRNVLILLGLLIVVLLAIQLVPYGRDHSNPPVLSEPQWDSPQTRALFMTACRDCHSNETAWPWWTRVAPSSWLVWNHVAEGRTQLNVSEWDSGAYDAEDAARLVRDGKMPLSSYVLMHPEAKLSEADRAALVKGLEATFGGSAEGESGEQGEEGEEGEG